MKRKVLIYLIVITCLIIVTIAGIVFNSSKATKSFSNKKDTLTVQAGWIINGEFANVCSAIVRGYYDEENLEVKLVPGGPSGANFIVATTAIAQNPRLDIGIDGDLVPLVKGVTKENPNERIQVKAFASFWNNLPYGFMTRKDSGITSLKDFGKLKKDGEKVKIGVTADFVLQSALAKYAGVNESDLEFVTVGFDATPLLTNQVDALAGYWTTQAYDLEKAGIPYNFLPISELPGFKQPSMIAVASNATLNTKKPQIERWMRATIKGSEFAIRNPELAAKDLADDRCGGKSTEANQETWLIKKSIPLYGNQIGKLDTNIAKSFTKAYHDIGQIPFNPDINSYTDLSVIDNINSK